MNILKFKVTCLLVVLSVSLNAFSAPLGERLTTNKQTLLLTISYDNASYHIEDAQVINGELTNTLQDDRLANTLAYQIVNGHGDAMFNGALLDPKILRGVLDEQGTQGHENFTQQQGIFVIRLPYHKDMEALVLSDQSTQARSRSLVQPKSPLIPFKHLLQ